MCMGLICLLIALKGCLCRVSSLPAAPRDALFLDLLRGVDELESTSPDLLRAASETAFVPAATGELAKPGDLYDPSSRELMMLLDPAKHFPADDFKSSQVCLSPSHYLEVQALCCLIIQLRGAQSVYFRPDGIVQFSLVQCLTQVVLLLVRVMMRVSMCCC